jgi:hypothetical protein
MKETLLYDSKSGKHTTFDKYWMDTLSVITHKESGEALSYSKFGKYNVAGVYDNDGKRRMIRVGRAVASTFLGPPPTLKHTADHKDRDQPDNDALENIRWFTPPEQRANQKRPETYKTAFVVVKNDLEKTVKEWVKHFEGKKNPFGNEYTEGMINTYARRKQHGFAYKEYPDLKDEMWKSVEGSENTQGRWEVSDMKRMKYVTKHASNVMWGDRLGLDNSGYPFVRIDGKTVGCHVVAFDTFYPELWAARKPGEMVRHKFDIKTDFRPHMLMLGDGSDNAKDAHDNGKHVGTKSERMPCFSYIDGMFEKEHESQTDAAKYLLANKVSNAAVCSINGNIRMALTAFENGETMKRYKRTWKPAPKMSVKQLMKKFKPILFSKFEIREFRNVKK